MLARLMSDLERERDHLAQADRDIAEVPSGRAARSLVSNREGASIEATLPIGGNNLPRDPAGSAGAERIRAQRQLMPHPKNHTADEFPSTSSGRLDA
jgi:hypothetical protein